MNQRSLPTPTVGLFLVVVGTIALLSELDFIGSIWRYWPLLVIIIGMTKVMEPRHAGERVEGMVVCGIGVWLLVSSLRIFGWGFRETWPLVLVIVGAHIIWQAACGPAQGSPREARND